MKLASVLFLLLTILTPNVRAQKYGPAEDFRETLSRATLAIYEGKQVCKWSSVTVGGFFLEEAWKWGCEFKSTFHCTATVVETNGDGHYQALTAGHCFHSPEAKYYVADDIGDNPVLREVKLLKYESTDRYDYALLTFSSLRTYPVIRLNGKDAGIPAIGTPVLNVNFGEGVGRATLEGKVASKGAKVETLKNRYLVSIGIGPGASGSAIVDANTHEIVGLAEAIFPGTQMSSIVIPTGTQLADFIDDDSAGLRDQPQAGEPPRESHSTSSTYSWWDEFKNSAGEYSVFVVRVFSVVLLFLLLCGLFRFLAYFVRLTRAVYKLGRAARQADQN